MEKFGTISNRSPRHTGAAGGPPVATSCTEPVVTSSTYRPSGDGKTARIPSGESEVEYSWVPGPVSSGLSITRTVPSGTIA